MSARAQVLGDFDLLEAIYLHTTTYEIQVATTVHPWFRYIVENSKPLKHRALALQSTIHSMYSPYSRYGSGTWHLFVPTASENPRRFSDGAIFILRIPSKGMENWLFAQQKHNYLQVLAGPKRKCRVLLFDNVYGRNVKIWDANEQWVCKPASLSAWGNGPTFFDQYMEMFYSSRRAGDMFYIGED